MKFSKASTLTIAAAVLSAPAMALTIENHDAEQLRLGIDEGATEHVVFVDAGQSADFSEQCKDGCGLTGPWGFSHMAAAGDSLTFKDGKLNGGKATVSPES